MFDRRLIQYFDWWLIGLTLILGAVGLVLIYSAVMAGDTILQKTLYGKQMVWFGIGLTAMVISFIFNYRLFDQWGGGIYIISIVLLVLVLVYGKHVAGARRWLVMGPLTIQPSELMKISVIIVLAKYYSKRASIQGFTLKELFMPMLLVIIPFLLIVKQPDLGTAMLIVLIAASITVYVKIERRSMAMLIGSGAILVSLAWLFFLKGYQKQRILTFFNPDRDPLGAGYHIIQSKIAIGSGMVFGKGFLKGTQNALSFLPEQHTDFILSVLAEEWGFAGTGFVLFLYMLLLVWGLSIAHGCRDTFGTILSVGVTAMLFWQIFINIGMVMGLMPVVGVPLPLISYGGSSVVTSLIGIGILMNVSMRRFMVE
ncbi:MAG: rod shape-determining protein RodA [Desulfobacterales bacterium]